MAAAKKSKASDKQGISKKIVGVLKKRYGSSVPKAERPILETVLYAICLENSGVKQADDAFERLESIFYDWNEIRVSTITEIEPAFVGMDDPEWRALRIKTTLNYIFEKKYAYDFEGLRRKTLELAKKQLNRLANITPFVRDYTLQAALGSHLVPVDDKMCHAAMWLGLLEADSTAETASDRLKSAVRKADAPLFCYLLRCLAVDDELAHEFLTEAPEDGFDLETATNRLGELFKNPPPKPKRVAPSTAKKSSSASTKKASAKAAKSATTGKAAAGTGKSSPPKTASKSSAKKSEPDKKRTTKSTR